MLEGESIRDWLAATGLVCWLGVGALPLAVAAQGLLRGVLQLWRGRVRSRTPVAGETVVDSAAGLTSDLDPLSAALTASGHDWMDGSPAGAPTAAARPVETE